MADWADVERIYHAALARPSAERSAFLLETCGGDEALRREVESLLANASSTPGVLDGGAVGVAAGLMSTPDHTVLTGRRLGVYQITAPLGKGGMGEVYRARDTRLGRDVAIKILPRVFLTDADRLARFEREARVLASLNHPNIATIHGIEDADGIRALVMELIDGETLAERIAKGPIPIAATLPLARQIADALDVAHEKGIVHRDLKPANIKITRDGAVKVLDFGLAKAAGPAAGDDAPTMTIGGTRDGAIVGTAAYMSPEQARGLAVDKRTDIWAFGCVLYEMLTGRPAFRGNTVSDIIAAILEREPDWRALPAVVPANVARLLKHCLDKDQRRRLRDIGEVTPSLDERTKSSEEPDAGSKGSPRWRGAALVATGVAILALAGFGLTRLRQPNVATDVSLGPAIAFTFDSGLTTHPSLSADGRLIAYASNRSDQSNLDVFVQQTTGGTAIRLTNDPADDHQPDVAPDGSLVAFRSERNPAGVYVASALGGQARLIAPDGRAPRFSPDSRFIAFEQGSWLEPISVGLSRSIFVVPAAGGPAIRLAVDLENAGGPAWSPDGKSLLVLARKGRTGGEAEFDWWHVPADPSVPPVATGVFAHLGRSGFRLGLDDIRIPYPRVWTSGGVFFSGAVGSGDSLNLWHMRVDHDGRPLDTPVRLTLGTTLDVAPTVSRDGLVAWAARTSVLSPFGFPIDAATGRSMGEPVKLRNDSSPTGRSAISRDGRLLIFARYEIASGILWSKDLMSGAERQLAALPRTPVNPAMSDDGRWVGYTVTKVQTGGGAGFGDGYAVETAGGVPQKACENCEVAAWTRDGQLVVSTAEATRLERVDLKTARRLPLVEAASAVDRPLFGPDGTWMTFNIGRQIVRAPVFPDRASREAEWTTIVNIQTSERTAGISPDGGLLYVLLESDGFRCLYAVRVDRTTGQRIGDPFPVVHVHGASRNWGTTGYGSAVGSGIFVANLSEYKGNIWMSKIAGAEPSTK